MSKIDLMLDIETMGVNEKPVVIQIGACYFDKKSGEILETFCQNIDMEDCLSHGFRKDESTEKWWKEQNQDILRAILEDARKTEYVIRDFKMFSEGAQNIWSHATFDFTIIQTYLKHFNHKPMPHKNARDIRTLTYLSGIDLKKYDWDKNKTHNALDDCRFQVSYCVDAMKMLGK